MTSVLQVRASSIGRIRERTWSGRALMWALIAIAALSLPFLSLPGRYVFDTRDPLWFDPSAYMSHAFVLWRQNPWLGLEQHDGIAVPMGVAVWALRTIGLAPWAAERLWHGALLFAAVGGVILLMDELLGRRTIVAASAAGLLYGLSPYAFAYGLQFTGVFLPYVLLPVLLLVTHRGIGRRGLVWPALFGLTTFLMGGGNGAPQVFVIATAVALMAWMAFGERRVTVVQALRFVIWSAVFTIGLNTYWLILLASSEVGNALAFTEQPFVINVSSSASETIRGLGFWQYYGGDGFGPWIPVVRTYITSLTLIASGFAVPLAALASAWLVRWRYRLFFLLLAIVSLFVAMGIFPVTHPTPFGRLLLFLYAHVPGAAGLRTTYKLITSLNLALAVLAGVGIQALWDRLRVAPLGNWLRACVVVVLFGLVAANASPLLAGDLYNPEHGAPDVPSYWRAALADLNGRDTSYRAFFAPATGWAIYRWGAIKEGITATDPTLPAIAPVRLPIGDRYGSNLETAVEQPYFQELPAKGTAQLMRYLGVRDIVLQNDLDWQRTHTARPNALQALVNGNHRDPQLSIGTTFGAVGVNTTAPGARGSSVLQAERTLAPVELLSVADPVEMVRAEGPDPVVLSGDGFGLASAARNGLLTGGPPVLYSGAMTPAQIHQVLADPGSSFLITDSNRRRVWSFTGPRAPASYTLPAGHTLGGGQIGYLLFGDQTDTQSVAVYPGLRLISASGYGSLLGGTPQYRPSNAFDGDPNTWWFVGAGRDPVGSWVQATFKRPTRLSSVTLTIPNSSALQPILQTRLEFSDGSAVTTASTPGTPQVIRFPTRTSGFLRVRITSVGPAVKLPGAPLATGAAIGDIAIPGQRPTEVIQVPTDLFAAAAEAKVPASAFALHPFTYLFERARTGLPQEPDEETAIRRRFETPPSGIYMLSGAGRLYRSASDEQIDQLVYGPRLVHVTSSSRLLNNPVVRGSAAFDGDLSTAWVAGGGAGQSLTVTFPATSIDRIGIEAKTALDAGFSSIQQVSVEFSDGRVATGSPAQPNDARFDVTFPKVVTSSVKITIQGVFDPTGAKRNPVAIQEVTIPGVDKLVPDQAGAPLPCQTGPGFTVDGRAVGIRIDGTVDQLLNGTTLRFGTCGAAAIVLRAGVHDLSAGGAFEPNTIELSSGKRTTQAAAARPSVSFRPSPDGGFDVRVAGASAPYYLVIGQNYAPGWTAAIAGKDLGAPLLLDGYSAGWRIDRPGSYAVKVRYAPQRGYTLALGATATAVVGTAAVFLLAGYRRIRDGRRLRRGGTDAAPVD